MKLDSPREMLYKIREGLNYAVEHKVEKYQSLKEEFVLKEEREGIRIKRRKKLTFEPILTQLANSQHLVVDKATTVLEVIGAAIHHKAPFMEFPNSDIHGDAFKRLEKWASLNQYKITQSSPHIIMERESINAAQASGVIEGERGVV